MALIMLQRADSLVLRTVGASRAVVCRAAVATRRSWFSPRPRMAVMTSGSAGTVIVASCWTAVAGRQGVRPCCRVYLLMVDGETPQAAAISISVLPGCISVARRSGVSARAAPCCLAVRIAAWSRALRTVISLVLAIRAMVLAGRFWLV